MVAITINTGFFEINKVIPIMIVIPLTVASVIFSFRVYLDKSFHGYRFIRVVTSKYTSKIICDIKAQVNIIHISYLNDCLKYNHTGIFFYNIRLKMEFICNFFMKKNAS